MSPTLIYDGDCGVCTKLSGVVSRHVRRRPDDYVIGAYQYLDLDALGVTAQQCDEALQWVAADGTVSAAQDAVARLLIAGRWWLRPAGWALLLPGVNQLAGAVYRWVAANRHRLPGGTPACSMPASQRPS
ncbi:MULTISPECIES: thiol-disulfide oxidoreductase DCC family protein [unclassified Janibacter]|uniref:thiol-disulfide oxidoreductase DCC family protein n=1 Tax=unclassified Janibacter TaxID=2649294 RepID=UPI003D0491DE